MRMQTVWRTSKTAIFNDLPDFSRMQESAHWRIITCEAEIEAHEVKHRFTQIKRRGFNCRSIKLFLSGKVPDLRERGFRKEGNCYIYQHEQIEIAALPYGKQEWCLMIEKRSGHGVPMHALDFIPLFETSHQETLWKEKSS